MPNESFLDKYPRSKQLLEETGMSLDQALIYTEIEIKKLGSNHLPQNNRERDNNFLSQDKERKKVCR